MSIRLIARELYELYRQVEDLTHRLADAPPDQKEGLQDRLRRVNAEKQRMKRVLEGRIDHTKKVR